MYRFKKAEFKNLELTGFYWVDEDIATCKDLSKYVSQYIHSQKKELVWIPYWKAKGYEQWKELGFEHCISATQPFLHKDYSRFTPGRGLLNSPGKANGDGIRM